MKKLNERSFKEVMKIAEKNNFEKAVLVEVEIEQEIDDILHLDYLKTDYHFNFNQELIIDNSMRYTQKDVEEEGQNKVLEWIENDEKRLNQFNKGEVWQVGIRAKAVIAIPSKVNKSYKRTIIKSAGLWGIDSDSSESHIQEIEEEQLRELENELKMLNVAGIKN